MHKLIKEHTILREAAASLFANKADNVVLIDLLGFPMLLYDFLLICTCQSEAQMRAVLSNTRKALKKETSGKIRTEHAPGSRWGVLDCGDLIVHAFEKNTRSYYSLERLWADADIIELDGADFAGEQQEEVQEDEFI